MSDAPPAVVTRLRALRDDADAADALLASWLRRFAAVADRGLRRHVLFNLATEADDATLLALLLRVERRARGGDAVCRWLQTELALTPSVLLDLPYGRCAELYAAARDAGEIDLGRRFLGAHALGPVRIPGAPPDDDLPRARSNAAARMADANPHLDMSAGVRTSSARQRDRLVLDRLLHDRDPRVIAALLDNPRVTERDVVRVAAMRPSRGDILSLIAAHPRWSQQYRVRKAIAFNPDTPSPLARQLVHTLLRQDLVALAGSRATPEHLRAAIQTQLGTDETPP